MNGQVQYSLTKKSNEIAIGQKELFRLFSILIVVTIILLIVSFIIIRLDLRKEDIVKLRLKQVIDENEELLDMRGKATEL